MVATNGMEALEQVQLSCPDLVVLDVVMPRINGYEVCRRQTDPKTQNVPVVMCSSKAKNLLLGHEARRRRLHSQTFQPVGEDEGGWHETNHDLSTTNSSGRKPFTTVFQDESREGGYTSDFYVASDQFALPAIGELMSVPLDRITPIPNTSLLLGTLNLRGQ